MTNNDTASSVTLRVRWDGPDTTRITIITLPNITAREWSALEVLCTSRHNDLADAALDLTVELVTEALSVMHGEEPDFYKLRSIRSVG